MGGVLLTISTLTDHSFAFLFEITSLKIKNKLFGGRLLCFMLCVFDPLSWVGQEVGTLFAFAQYLLVQLQRCREFVQWIIFKRRLSGGAVCFLFLNFLC